ncbi:hypothetical protein G6O67_001583 [Ophiocordyceps sinensis]|uniref:Uncharacterized protein n=1 Tax=Ophiocordyceps sinensis TaxID=72228 RepID=A0A8H4PXU4_9HYPO|nr:hypothetical protein G6O67_001583 [Ophiocordyceps sinensis]
MNEPENPRLPSSSPALEDLFDRFFDWPAFSAGLTAGLKSPVKATSSQYPASPPAASENLSPLVTGFPASLLDHHLSLDDLGAGLIRMRTFDESAAGSDYSGQTPPELVQGGSTSPSDHSGSVLPDQPEDPHHRPHVTLREAQAHDDEWTYPQTEPATKAARRRYPPHIHVQGDPSGSLASAQATAGQKRRRSGSDAEKRQRQLVDPVQTADVRKSGACLPCRVTKTRCHESGVCPSCRKAFPDHSHLVCTRITPAMAWPIATHGPDVWSRNARQEEKLCACPRKHIGKPKEIAIFLTKDTTSPALLATVQPYTSNDDPDETVNPSKADFPRDHVPSYETLQGWVEGQIRREQKPAFAQTLQSFLLAYSEGGRGLPKHDLVENVHKMSCFFRIWRMSSFSCRDPTNRIANLPLSVQARLRKIAREALKSLEYRVLKSLDECLGQHAQPQPAEKMAVWTCLWQLILMYRDLLTACKAKITRLDNEGGEDAHDVNSYKEFYRQLADTYFPLVAIFYHYQFRTKKSLDLSLDWLEAGLAAGQALKKRAEIRRLGQQLLDARKDMYQALQSSKDHGDCLLRVLVVDHELKKLTARRRAPKDAAKPKGSRSQAA